MMRISVVVPCHNHGAYLDEAIISALHQRRRPCQIVIVDDASTDDSWLMASRWGGMVTPLRLAERGGTAAALNAAIAAASGDIIAVLHADDRLEPWHLAELAGAVEDNPRRFVYGDLRLLVDGEKLARLRFGPWDMERAKRKNIAHGAIVFPRTAWVEVGGYPDMPEGREDWAMTLRLGAHGWSGLHVSQPDPSYLYRRHAGNRSAGNHTPEWTARFWQQLGTAVPEVYG